MNDDADQRDSRCIRAKPACCSGMPTPNIVCSKVTESGRMPHAWLIGGERGIGKATLAYRLARFVLAHPDPSAPAVQTAQSLAVDPENPVARRVAAQAQGDLLVLERVINEKTGKLFTVIRAEDVRRTVSFFGSTAARAAGASASSTTPTSCNTRKPRTHS